ncbi:unannotated protein [freshwater metagenome]|uniref:Unannotated protein n=1 Tax=freshwater metagenome TaxID=449393 RepID=A0A6J7HK36_9ZZZZ
MARLFRTIALIGLATFAFAPAAAQAATCPNADLQPTAANAALVTDATLCLLNEQRAAEGLPALVRQGDLDRASTAYASKMVVERFFDHIAPDGSTVTRRLRAVNYIPTAAGWEWSVGENIGWAEYYLATPASMVKAWMASPGHRANILSDTFREIGVGIVPATPISAAVGATYVTDFGRRTYNEAPVIVSTVVDTPVGSVAISRMGLQMKILMDRTIKLRVRVQRLAQAGLAGHDLGTKTIRAHRGTNALKIKLMAGHRITVGRYRVTITCKGAAAMKRIVVVRY